MRVRFLASTLLLAMLPAATLRAQTSTLLTMEEIKKLVEAGQFKDAQPPILRALALQGPLAAGYDRWELYMLRAECQIQNKESQGALASLDSARKEAVTTKHFEKLAAPTAFTFLIQKATNFQYTPKNSKEAIPILDRTLRPAAYAALLVDETPAVKLKVEALNNVKTIAPVLETAKAVGTLRALEVVTKPEVKADKLQTTALAGPVTSNADRLLTAAIAEYNKQVAAIASTANQIVHDQVGMYDPISKKSWLQPRTRRRGLTNQDGQTLNEIIANCEKVHATAAEIATALGTDFDAYQAIVDKALAVKAKATATATDDYLLVPQ